MGVWKGLTSGTGERIEVQEQLLELLLCHWVSPVEGRLDHKVVEVRSDVVLRPRQWRRRGRGDSSERVQQGKGIWPEQVL